jgi:hypothetical protein
MPLHRPMFPVTLPAGTSPTLPLHPQPSVSVRATRSSPEELIALPHLPFPTRAKPAREVEKGDHERLEEPEHRRNAGGKDSRVRDVHFRLGGGGGSEELLRVGCRGREVRGQDQQVCEALGGFVGVLRAEALDVGEGEEVQESGDAADPDYAAGWSEEGREPVREHVVAKDVCCEDLA